MEVKASETSPIPHISDERLHELAERIKPLVRHANRNLFYIKPVDLRTIAFTWNPVLTEQAPPMKKVAAIPTFHSYGAPVFFKPSIAEVLAQIPEEIVETVDAFSIEGGIEISDGYHVAVTDLYQRESSQELEARNYHYA